MKHTARVDTNQVEIVEAFRQLGCSVQHLHTIGSGCPDLLIGFRGANVLVEIKTQHGALTADQIEFHDTWRGSNVEIVRSINEVIELIAKLAK